MRGIIRAGSDRFCPATAAYGAALLIHLNKYVIKT